MEHSRRVRLDNLHHEWAQQAHKPNLRHKRWITRSDTELARHERGLIYVPGGARGTTKQERNEVRCSSHEPVYNIVLEHSLTESPPATARHRSPTCGQSATSTGERWAAR